MMKNYYSILGVTPDSSDAEIKLAYRHLARKYHPDVNPYGTSKFKDITEAYEVLSDPKKKINYDTINGFFKSSPKKEEKSDSYKKDQYSYNKYSTSNKKADFKYKKEEAAKKFNTFFDNLSKKQDKKDTITPQNGKDIIEEISITLKESVNGTQRVINVMHACECPNCFGRKFINGTKCKFCDGTGEKIVHKKINVKIPKNVKNGTKLRIAKEGSAGKDGGKNGDLYLKIKIEPNSRISFEGNDVVYNVPINPFEAVLGGSITIPSFNEKLSLKIPANTHSGQKFRLAGQGIDKNGKIGDMIVIVHIEIPCSLSDDEIRLYEKLKKISSQNIRENLLNE